MKPSGGGLSSLSDPHQPAGAEPAPRVPLWMRVFGRAPAFGIITAMPEEFSAMKAMIERPVTRRVAQDSAEYVCGVLPSASRGRPHRVVLTLLAETGNDAASSGCTHLVRSFPTVRQILMVGVAAGVPAPHGTARQVRLGDVVVSTSGIVDFDHVVETDAGRQLRQPFPRPSPLLVRYAKVMQAEEQTGLRPWEVLIERAQSTLEDFGRPPADTDVMHDGGEPRPTIHLGRIGSADKSVRSAAIRDELAALHQLIAIEMEGKGLGRAAHACHRDWFEVRGISDYGDRHTTVRWRRYAALTAAAYTAALLAQCPPQAVHRRRRFGAAVVALMLGLALPGVIRGDWWPLSVVGASVRPSSYLSASAFRLIGPGSHHSVLSGDGTELDFVASVGDPASLEGAYAGEHACNTDLSLEVKIDGAGDGTSPTGEYGYGIAPQAKIEDGDEIPSGWSFENQWTPSDGRFLGAPAQLLNADRQMGPGKPTADPRQWHKVHIATDGTSYQVDLDGRPFGRFSDSVRRCGVLLLRMYGGVKGAFRNIAITHPAKPPF